jgi:hypothetical protein
MNSYPRLNSTEVFINSLNQSPSEGWIHNELGHSKYPNDSRAVNGHFKIDNGEEFYVFLLSIMGKICYFTLVSASGVEFRYPI